MTDIEFYARRAARAAVLAERARVEAERQKQLETCAAMFMLLLPILIVFVETFY